MMDAAVTHEGRGIIGDMKDAGIKSFNWLEKH
jgi:hypothetical protein